ncbi:MAG: cupin domain-containing protein [Rhodoglobus sp.]
MTDALQSNAALNALTESIALEVVPTDQVEAGAPSAGARELVQFGETEIGIWEHTPGASTDIEVDEVFVVLSGRATVEFVESGETLRLEPGVVGRLAAGTATRWTVTETLRKIYLD